MRSPLQTTGLTKRRVALVHVWLVVGLLLAAASAAARQERPSFEFAESGALVFEPGKASEVRVLNNTTRPLTLAVSLLDTNAAADGRGLSSFVEVAPTSLPVPEAGGAKFTLSVRHGATLEPGSPLTAYLVISEGGSGKVLRRPVSVSATPTPSGSPTPTPPVSMVGTLKVTAYCWPQSDDCDVDGTLPLDKEMTHEQFSNFITGKETLARLSTVNGDTALVTYKGDVQEPAGNTTGVRLGFKSSGGSGEYTGKLSDIKTGGEKPDEIKPVSLTVVSKHHVLCAALIVLAGILTYYLMQWYINVLRKVSLLKQQEAELEAAFDETEQHFKRTAAGSVYENDSIRVDFKEQAGALLKEITKLRFSNFLRLDENGPAFKAIVTKLEALGKVVEQWGAFFEGKLKPLADALTASGADSVRRPPGLQADVKAPKVALEAEVPLASSREMSIAEFNARAARADELAPRLASWRRLNDAAARVWGRFQDIVADAAVFATLTPLKQDDIKAKREQALLIWIRLWTRDDFDPVQVKGSLNDLEDFLTSLAGDNQPVVAAVVAAAAPEVAAREASPAERAKRIGQVRLGLDLLHFAITLAVAVYSTVALFYFNQTWGTLRDYVAAFVMGAGTKPVLDTVVGALGRFTSRLD